MINDQLTKKNGRERSHHLTRPVAPARPRPNESRTLPHHQLPRPAPDRTRHRGDHRPSLHPELGVVAGRGRRGQRVLRTAGAVTARSERARRRSAARSTSTTQVSRPPSPGAPSPSRDRRQACATHPEGGASSNCPNPRRHRPEVQMSRYLFIARYASDGVKGVAAAGGSARRSVIQKLAEGLGGRMETFDFAFGEDDVYTILELPTNTTAAAVALAVNSTGQASVRTVALLTSEEIDDAAKQTVRYTPPGAS